MRRFCCCLGRGRAGATTAASGITQGPGSGFEMFFAAAGARHECFGIITTTAGGKTWSSMSFTEKVMLEEQDIASVGQMRWHV